MKIGDLILDLISNGDITLDEATYEKLEAACEKTKTEVMFAYNYGDHWRTEVAAEIDEVIEAEVVHSDYHQMDKVVDPDAEDVEDVGEDEKRMALILR